MSVHHVSVHHVDIEFAGQVVAEAISLGENWILFSAHPDLSDLDGSVYATASKARRAVWSMLTGSSAKQALALSA